MTSSITSNTILLDQPESNDTVPRSSFLRLQETLEKTKAELYKQVQTNAALQQAYSNAMAKLKTSQLANCMLRRLHHNERGCRFHKWLDLLEVAMPGELYSIMNHAYSFLDSSTIHQHLCVCTAFWKNHPKHMTRLTIVRRDDGQWLNDTGMNHLLLSLTSLSYVTISRFTTTQHSMMFGRGLRSKKLIVLDLTKSCIGPVAASELGRGSFPNLEVLRMQSNNLRSEGLAGLFKNGLGSQKLKYLQLNRNQLSMNALGSLCDRGMQALGNSLHAYRHTLEILDLDSNGIDDGGIHSISQGIEMMERLSVLKMRYGARNVHEKNRMNSGISDQGGISLARALKKSMLLRTSTSKGDGGGATTKKIKKRNKRNKQNTQDVLSAVQIQLLDIVDVRDHRIGNLGVIALVRALYGNGRTPEVVAMTEKTCRLMLQGNPTIGEAVVRPLATSMKWDGSLEFMRQKIIETFGIWKEGGQGGGEKEEDDNDKEDFQWKVRSQQLEQSRKRASISRLL